MTDVIPEVRDTPLQFISAVQVYEIRNTAFSCVYEFRTSSTRKVRFTFQKCTSTIQYCTSSAEFINTAKCSRAWTCIQLSRPSRFALSNLASPGCSLQFSI